MTNQMHPKSFRSYIIHWLIRSIITTSRNYLCSTHTPFTAVYIFYTIFNLLTRITISIFSYTTKASFLLTLVFVYAFILRLYLKILIRFNKNKPFFLFGMEVCYPMYY